MFSSTFPIIGYQQVSKRLMVGIPSPVLILELTSPRKMAFIMAFSIDWNLFYPTNRIPFSINQQNPKESRRICMASLAAKFARRRLMLTVNLLSISTFCIFCFPKYFHIWMWLQCSSGLKSCLINIDI